MGLFSNIFVAAIATCSTCFHQIDDKEALKKHATSYEESYSKYANTDQGRFERSSKNALRTAYLSCGATDEEILDRVRDMKKVSKKCREWIKKCSKGLLVKQDPKVSLEAFVKQAKSYQEIYDLVKESEEYINYNTTHKEFKKEVIELFKHGCTVEDITNAMKESGIEDMRILSRPLYWKTKSID